MKDYYRILGVESDSDFPILKKAYYRRAMACHPDRFGGNPQKAEAFKTLVEAFNVLSDPRLRARYDMQRAVRTSSGGASLSEAAYIRQDESILDTFADDILEEMIVGNTVPRDTTLQTLLLDLERTEQFCLFREGKNHFYAGRIPQATAVFQSYLKTSAVNILAHYFLGRCYALQRRYRPAALEFIEAIRIGRRRQPPLHMTRIRHELDQIRQHRIGARTRLLAWWLGTAGHTEPLPPDVEMKHQVNRAIHRHLMEEHRRRHTLLGKPGGE